MPNPNQLFSSFSPAVQRKAETYLTRQDVRESLAQSDFAPQLWDVPNSDGTSTYAVRLVCIPTKFDLANLEIQGANCTCPNGKNSPLGRAKCYHFAAVVLHVSQLGA